LLFLLLRVILHLSYYFESASGVFYELQCGSYAFMDADYGRVNYGFAQFAPASRTRPSENLDNLPSQSENSGSGNKCLRAIGTTTRSLRNWVRSAKNLI
jgi:hypothetical protein